MAVSLSGHDNGNYG